MRLSSIVFILLNSSSYTLGTVSTTSEPAITLGRGLSVASGTLLGRSGTSRGSSQHMLRSSSEGLGMGQLSPPSVSPGGSRVVPSESLLASEDEERPSFQDPVLPFGVYGDVFGADDALRQRLTRPSNSRILIVPPGGSAAARNQAISHDLSTVFGGAGLSSSGDPIADQVEADILAARSRPRGRHNPLADEDETIQKLANEIDRNRHEVPAPALGVPGPEVDADLFRSETIPNVGKLTLRRLMGQGETSTVYTLVETTDLVIKYQTDCPSAPNQNTHHPLVLDYYFHKKVESLGITPRVEAISPSEFVPEKPDLKCSFGMSRETYNRCRGDGLGTVRYMVMARTGESIADAMRRYPHRQFPFSAAIRLGIQLMEMLEKLHTDAGVVHGDIHFGNVVFRDRTTDGLMLIDFGRSFSIPSSLLGGSLVSHSAASMLSTTSNASPSVLSSSPPMSLGGFRTPPTASISPPERISSAFEWTSYQMSPWEIAGYRPAPRDDAYKALMVMSFMIHGDPVLSYLKDLDRNSTNVNLTSAARMDAIKTAYRYKMYEDMLVVPGGRHDVLQVKQDLGRISREQRERISELFGNVATHIRKLGINALPNYEYIIDQLKTILGVYREHATPPSSLTDSGLWTRSPCNSTTTNAPTR